MPFTAAEIAKALNGVVEGKADVVLHGFAPADQAGPGDLVFAENEEYFQRAVKSAAAAILVSGTHASDAKVLIRVSNARVGFARALTLFHPERLAAPGVHPTAVVAASARVDATSRLGPHCVVGERSVVGPDCTLDAGVVIGADCLLGEAVRLFPNVTVYDRTQMGNRVRIHAGAVIGSDGFGYVFDQGAHFKVPQVGNVVIQDDVEIGANTTIDRGALGSTVIGRGSKIDNLVQIAHNVVVGENCILVSQVGVAGSTRLGNFVTLAGQVGLAGHLRVGSQVTVAAQSGVMHDIPDKETWLGTPAGPDRQTKRQYLAIQKLPELIRRVRQLERRAGLGEDGDAPAPKSG